MGQTMIIMEPPPAWWVRFKLGTVGLTQRTTHALPVPAGFPTFLTAYCGQEIAQLEADIVEPFTGQPCNLCLLRLPVPVPVPVPDEPLQLPGSDPLQLLAGTELHDDG